LLVAQGCCCCCSCCWCETLRRTSRRTWATDTDIQIFYWRRYTITGNRTSLI